MAFAGWVVSPRQIASLVLLVSALILAGVFLATRGPKRTSALAVYARSDPAGNVPRVLFVESFDLLAHRSIPLRVEEVVGKGPGGEHALDFEQEGERPAVIRLRQISPQVLRLRARNDLGSLEGEVARWGDVVPPTKDFRSLGWPIEVRCDRWRVTLLADTGVLEVGSKGRVLVLFENGWGAEDRPESVSLRVGSVEASAVFETWGGAILEVQPRVARTLAHLILRGAGRTCESSFLMTAASRRTRVHDVHVFMTQEGHYRLSASVRSHGGGEVFALLARHDTEQGVGPLVDARIFEVRDGFVRVLMDLPGPGLYQVRFTTEPLQVGPWARGVDVIVVAGTEHLPAGWPKIGILGLADEQAREAALPFMLATLAAASPISVTQVANTSSEVRAESDKARARRDAWLIGALASCLVGLVVLMGAEVVAAYSRARRAGPDAILKWSGLLWAAAVAGILLAAVAALVFVLKTM